MKNSEYVRKQVFRKIRKLCKDDYSLVANPLCRGYQSVDTWFIYESKYRKKNVIVIELPSRFKYAFNRNKSNNYHCRLIFSKEI